MTTRYAWLRNPQTGKCFTSPIEQEFLLTLFGSTIEDLVEQARADVAREPRDALAWKQLGALLLHTPGGAQAAEEAYAQAAHLGLDDSSVWHNLGLARLERGDLVPALCLLERASALGPDSPRTWQRLGQARLRAGDSAGAVEALDRSTRLAPDWPEFWRTLGAAYCGVRRYLDACEAFRRALSCEGCTLSSVAEAGILKALAAAECMAGEKDAAVETMRRSVSRWPAEDREGKAAAWAHLGGHCMMAERHAESAEVFETALRLDPGNPKYLEELVHECRLAGEPDLAQGALWRLYGVDAERAHELEFGED